MTNVSHIRGAGGAMRLTERDLDAQIASNRERFYDTLDPFVEFERWKERRIERRAKPSVIALDTSLLARASRWLRAFFLNRSLL